MLVCSTSREIYCSSEDSTSSDILKEIEKNEAMKSKYFLWKHGSKLPTVAHSGYLPGYLHYLNIYGTGTCYIFGL